MLDHFDTHACAWNMCRSLHVCPYDIVPATKFLVYRSAFFVTFVVVISVAFSPVTYNENFTVFHRL